jgi:HlyD family secretion protein
MKKNKLFWIIGAVVVVAAAVIVYFVVTGNNSEETVFNTIEAKNGRIGITITATGEIQPVTQVEVGTQVSGVIEKLYVDFNSVVTKGQLLAEIDRSNLIEQYKQAQAGVSDAESNLTLMQQNYDRVSKLFNKKAATQISLEEAVNKLSVAKNQYATAKSNLQKSEVNLSYAHIFSPISGVILNRAVDEGQTVAASFNTPTLFTIANDLTKMQVEASVDEADIGKVKVGQMVNFSVDAFPDDSFIGTVTSIRMQPTVVSNVVTYSVMINAPNPDLKLLPGMTANTSIIVEEADGIVIPADAFNFTPDAALLAQFAPNLPASGGAQIPELNGNINANHGIVWIQSGQTIHPQVITKGITDRTSFFIPEGLQMGDTVILSVSKVKKTTTSEVKNPFMMRPPQSKSR